MYGDGFNRAVVATAFPDPVRNSAQTCSFGFQFIEQLLHPVLKLSDRIDAVLLTEVFDYPEADSFLPGGELLLNHRAMGRLINSHHHIRSIQVSFRDLFWCGEAGWIDGRTTVLQGADRLRRHWTDVATAGIQLQPSRINLQAPRRLVDLD